MRTCNWKQHRFSGSKYERESVPIEYFRKPGKPDTDLYKMCLDCRAYNKKCRDVRKEKIKEIADEYNNDLKFKVCEHESHRRNSTIPREKVPKSMFLIHPNDPKSISNYCSDCRQYQRSIKLKSTTLKKESLQEGQFWCSCCCNIKGTNERATNLDGTQGKVCVPCQDYQKKYNKDKYVEMKENYRRIQKQFILEHQTCCQICNCIFLRSKEENGTPIEIPIRKDGNNNLVDYNDKTYQVKDFLEEFIDLIEYRILDFDHLTEEEQRDMNLLADDEDFVGKKSRSVMHRKTDVGMREESKKCQIVDCRCHVKITIAREQEVREQGTYKPSGKTLEKRRYIDELKKQGCSICGFYDETILRFLEMDHLDPSEKNNNIGTMVVDSKCSLEELISESDICRVICRFCHRIHTDWQRKQNMIEWKKVQKV